MIACEKSSVEIVETLIGNSSMNFHLEDSRKKNALFYAIDNKNKERGEKYIRLILARCPKLVLLPILPAKQGVYGQQHPLGRRHLKGQAGNSEGPAGAGCRPQLENS